MKEARCPHCDEVVGYIENDQEEDKGINAQLCKNRPHRFKEINDGEKNELKK